MNNEKQFEIFDGYILFGKGMYALNLQRISYFYVIGCHDTFDVRATMNDQDDIDGDYVISNHETLDEAKTILKYLAMQCGKCKCQ